MKLEQYRTLWGNLDCTDGRPARAPFQDIEALIPKLAELGYNGIEAPCKSLLFMGPEKVKALLIKHKMKLTCMVFTDNVVVPGEGILWGGPYPGFTKPTTGEEMAACLRERSKSLQSAAQEQSNGKKRRVGDAEEDLPEAQKKVVATHIAVFKEQVQKMYELFGDANTSEGGLVRRITSHSLKDNFPHRMAYEFFKDVLPWEKEHGYFVCHETHRKRFLHSPWCTRDFLLTYPDIRRDLKMCADLSHWINVAETDTNDPVLNDLITELAPMFHHTHCRVGYDHGPQVADPRAPEWLPYMEGHERWWDAIWHASKKRGDALVTMIAEHGPPNYQQTLPYSREPLAHIWDVNHWIHLRRQKRFEALFCSGGAGGKDENSKLVPSETQGYEPETRP
eukprot:TRINITY_DN104535_c0_g1_i1.p1 TRINITY_DN104535_c0_g1~~TRINITY_DN104535_c0_g1_i1.p1  ORF type:complete len:393 (+),score=53.90 TRINITY_DN104535_c0_g1_i1:115-1293(+)